MTSSNAFRPSAVLRLHRLVPALVLAWTVAGCGSDAPNPVRPGTSGPKLLIAVDTDRPPSPNGGYDLYFYDVSTGAPAFRPANLNTIFDESTSGFSADGRWLVFNSTRQLTGTQAQIFLYDVRTANTFVPDAPRAFQGAQNPTLSGDGSRMAFHYQIGFDFFDLTIALVDAVADTVIPTPSLHAPLAGEFDPSLSADGSLIAFTTTRDGSLDVMLYSVPGDSIVPMIGLNTGFSETGVTISGNGRYLAFHSNRPGGSGLFDLYVYDRQVQALLPLPGANTALSELNPAISNDGRYVAYTSENDGAGDIRLYDTQAQRLVPVPGLNDPYYIDRFPSITVAN